MIAVCMGVQVREGRGVGDKQTELFVELRV